MFNLCIFLKNSTVQYVLVFISHDTARAAREVWKTQIKAKAERTTIKDDYGHELDLPTLDLATIYIENTEKKFESAFDSEIIRRRVDAAFMEKRKDDMELMRLFPGQMPPARGGMQ